MQMAFVRYKINFAMSELRQFQYSKILPNEMSV